jgi:hypothetical protein
MFWATICGGRVHQAVRNSKMNRWLSITGDILSTEFGNPVALKLNTLKFWEAAALRGTGKPLSELFAYLGTGKIDSARVRDARTRSRAASWATVGIVTSVI